MAPTADTIFDMERRHKQGSARFFLLTAAPVLPIAALVVAATAAPKPPTKGDKPAPSAKTDAALFDSQVWPILKTSCVPCHAGSEASGGLDLTNREALLKGGESGPAVSLQDPEKSLLMRAVHYDGRQMPPQGKLPQAQIAVLSRWVRLGAPWSAQAKPVEVHHGPPQVNDEARRFWAFRAPARPTVPKVANKAWSQNPIDAFIFAKLQKNSLTPAAAADRATLLRRATFDVTGLPPTPQEVQNFVADKSPNAWAKVVDRLLASPHYGEQWGRHWLDLVRYAETNSYERDGDKPFVWRYRDYVIRSFNDDKPYDRFIREQLAGDELANSTPETLIATGYYRLGLWDDEPSDPEQARFDDLDDIVSTTGQTFLGLTVGCARCHDHKIDPFPTRDYYALVAFFRNVNRYGVRSYESVVESSLRPISSPAEQTRYKAESEVYNGKLNDLRDKMKPLEEIVRADLKGGEKDDWRYEQNRLPLVKKRAGSVLTDAQVAEYTKLSEARAELRARPPKGLEMALCVTEEGGKVPQTFVLTRGSVHAPAEEVAPGYPSVLTQPGATLAKFSEAAPTAGTTSGRRKVLANWIASPKNPLTARVMANRVWQFHFGRGIVRSTSNFGYMGTAPTHPELLDYLATELVRNNWKLKPLHRQILLSRTYQMSSKANGRALAKDPENDMFWRFDMRRLTAEEMRDSVLAVTGGVNPKMFGPSILVTLPQEVLAGQSVPGQGWGQSPPDEQRRRSVYIKVKRSLSVPVLAAFDAADTDATCPVRFATTQPTQALGMLNGAWAREQAQTMAQSIQREVGSDPSKQVKLVLWRVFQRPPTQAEVARGVKFMATAQREEKQTSEQALATFCLLSLNLNEFAYLD